MFSSLYIALYNIMPFSVLTNSLSWATVSQSKDIRPGMMWFIFLGLVRKPVKT